MAGKEITIKAITPFEESFAFVIKKRKASVDKDRNFSIAVKRERNIKVTIKAPPICESFKNTGRMSKKSQYANVR